MIKDFFLGDQPFPEVAFLKAFLYFHGYGVANDDTTAFACCERAAAAGLPCAQYLLAVMYLSGRGTASNTEKALEWFRKAAESGHALAAGAISHIYEEKRDGASAKLGFEWALRAAELGSLECAIAVGLRFQEGRGTEQDLEKALSWYTKASEMGDPEAIRLLGDFYRQGLGGLGVDVSRAKQLLSRAQEAEKVHQLAHFRFLRELAMNGDRSAQKYLVSVYQNGWLGQAADEAKAAYWKAKSKEVPSEP